MSQIIVNANAPIVKITIEVDYRYNPETIKLDMSPSAQFVPPLAICKSLAACLANLLQMLAQGKPQQTETKIPDLPPAPQSN